MEGFFLFYPPLAGNFSLASYFSFPKAQPFKGGGGKLSDLGICVIRFFNLMGVHSSIVLGIVCHLLQ